MAEAVRAIGQTNGAAFTPEKDTSWLTTYACVRINKFYSNLLKDMLEFIVAYHGWLGFVVVMFVGAVAGEIVARILRRFGLTPGRLIATTALVVGPIILGTIIGLNTLAAPYFYGECCRERVTTWLTQSPVYATLVEHHPEAKTALVAAGVKMGMGGRDAIVGQVEFSAVLNHYLKQYLPVTSDKAARELVMATTAIVDEMLKSEPELCIDVLSGQNQKMARRLPNHVFARYGHAVGRVITDGITNPQAAPDPRYVRWQRQRVGERMAHDGNPLATDPNRLMADPNRACFALLAIFDAVAKTVPQDEIGTFLRGTIPDFLKDDEA